MEKEKKGLEDLKELKGNSFLPPIRKDFKMEILSEEELTERSKVANERKETAQSYAEQEIKIRTALQLYKSKVPNWDFLPWNDPVRMEINRLQKRLEELVNIDGDLGEGKEFSKLVIEVQLIDEFGPAVKMMEHLEKQEKRIWAPSADEIRKAREENKGKWNERKLSFNGQVYFQKLETPGARLLNKRVREMIGRANASKINKMAAAGSHNLKGLRRGRIIPGKYYLFSPFHKDDKTGKVRLESNTVVEIYDKNKNEKNARPYLMMRVEDAFGGTSWMIEIKKPFPAFWFEIGKVLAKEDDRRLNEDEKEHIGHVIKVLNGIVFSWENEQKKSAPVPASVSKVPDPVPVAPAPEEVPVDHKITAEDGSEVKVFVKPKKGTKIKAAEPAESLT